MKKLPIINQSIIGSYIVLAIVILCFPFILASQEPKLQEPLRPIQEKEIDKTLSPYFFVRTADAELDQLPLKATNAEVNIAGVVADVKVTQVYVNNGKKPLEATYVFPASTRAAVYAMQMRIGNRQIIAKIEEKKKARKQYEQAKADGKSASLLEQERPNVFQMNVANIMPGDTIAVEMSYTEMLIPEEGIYEFVDPTVVGPRYSNKPENTASTDDKWVSSPYSHQGVKPTYKLDIHVNIQAGMKIQAVSCPTHRVSTTFPDSNSVQLVLKKKDYEAGNRDFIIQYKLADNTIESGLLLYKDEKTNENFFLAMIQTPVRPKITQVPPREFIFVMDVSGSMNGYPVETEKKLLKNLVIKLRPIDKFNLVMFAGGSAVLSENSLSATPENMNKALTMIGQQYGSGVTELIPALKKALSLKKAAGCSRTFVITTDGYVDVEKDAFDLIRNNLNNANFFTFGVGTSVNRYIIEGMANAGMGASFVVTNQNECDEQAEKFRNYIQTPVLTDIKADYDTFQTYDIEPINIPDALAERPIVIFGKWNGNETGIITIKGKTGNDVFVKSFDVSNVKVSNSNIALKYLWAREKIKMLDDYVKLNHDSTTIKEVAALGLKYNLLTNYTSFIAIDNVVRNKDGNSTKVIQPLPLPDKVNDNAVGANNVNSTIGYVAPVILEDADVQMNSMSSASKQILCMSSQSYSSPLIDADEGEVVNSLNTQNRLEKKREALILEIAEQMPAFNGGEAELYKFLSKNLQYPAVATQTGLEGKLIVEFIIAKNGEVKDVKIVKGSIGGGCEEELIRLIKLTSFKWIPGTQNGRTVEIKYRMPFVFKLNK